MKNIGKACIKSGTVRRLIYTGSVLSASPLKDDDNGFKELMDETCWTPLNIHFAFTDDYLGVNISFSLSFLFHCNQR